MVAFHDASHRRHAAGFSADLTDPKRKKISESWFKRDTADYWRHARSYEIAKILGGQPGEKWLTVGDGRFGLDSIRLREGGVAEVMPTDISEDLLKAAQEQGLITRYRVENAERLTFPDHAFDFVFCKEAFHHFPRPMLALYEMLRVSTKGVILIEPNDRSRSVLRRAKAALNAVLGRRAHMDALSYEEDGNYIFSISRREIEKVALGLNMPQVAFKGFNDFYCAGVEFAAIDSALGKKMRRRIAFKDMLCSMGLDEPALLMAGLFHFPLGEREKAAMSAQGWQVVDLPRNPYHPD